MKEVERIFRLVVTTLSDKNPDRLRAPIEVAEFYQSLIPYRQYRQVLGFDTNEDYEMALLRFLAGEGGYASLDPAEAQEALQEEARAVNPHPGAFREYAAAQVYLNVRAVEALSTPQDAYAPPGRAGNTSGSSADARATGARAASDRLGPFPPPPPGGRGSDRSDVPGGTTQPMRMRPTVGAATFEQATAAGGVPGAAPEPAPVAPGGVLGTCGACAGALPPNRKVAFCPHCGANVKPSRCPACGAELESDWRFCITCGRSRSPGG